MTTFLSKTAFITIVTTLLLSCQGSNDPSPGVRFDVVAEKSATDSEGNEYTVSFEQVSSNNQDPLVVKKDASDNIIWRLNHESSPVDGRAIFIIVDSNDIPYVVFTVDGGSNESSYITRKEVSEQAFSDVYQSSYGQGGGAKASIVARLDPQTGRIERGTFITARLTNGNTNTLVISKFGLAEDQVVFEVESAAWPPAVGTSYQRFPDITDEDRIDGSFRIWYELQDNFASIVDAALLEE